MRGYGYLPDIDISVQGKNPMRHVIASSCWREASGSSLTLSVIWRPKDKTTFPGERSPLTIRSRQAQDAITAVAETVAS